MEGFDPVPVNHPIDLRPVSPLTADRTPIPDVVDRLGEASHIKEAIKRYVNNHALPVTPDSAFADAAAAALRALFTDGDLCSGE